MGVVAGRSTRSLAVMQQTVPPSEWAAKSDVWSLIAMPFLDTSFRREERTAVRAELKRRGISGTKLLGLSLFAFGGLWWNFAWGEWLELGWPDIVWGYVLNVMVAIAVVVAFVWHWVPALVIFAVMVIFPGQSLKRRVGERHDS